MKAKKTTTKLKEIKELKKNKKIIKLIGRPKLYNTAEEMIEVLENYFNDCEKRHAHYTITGICIALGMSRETLRTYEKQEEFSDTIKEAKLLVENHLENALYDKDSVGVRFNLSTNFGWKDKTNVEHSGAIGSYEASLRDVADLNEY